MKTKILQKSTNSGGNTGASTSSHHLPIPQSSKASAVAIPPLHNLPPSSVPSTSGVFDQHTDSGLTTLLNRDISLQGLEDSFQDVTGNDENVPTGSNGDPAEIEDHRLANCKLIVQKIGSGGRFCG